jgi:lipoate-protein ligase A
VEELTVRLMPDERAGGPHHMAADEVLLRSAADGIASLRFYTWETPTLSLGYFQKADDRLTDPLLAELPFVRRATGGGALVHHYEQTYCLAVPATRQWLGRCWLRMHEVISAALAEFGVPVDRCTLQGAEDSTHFLCFQTFTPGDLLLRGAKIAGSAQRKQRGAVMQHGGILLRQSPFTPSLPGILELTGVEVKPLQLRVAILEQLKKLLGWRFDLPEGWTEDQRQAIEELRQSCYGCDSWNQKR